jgi:hypothetical protein
MYVVLAKHELAPWWWFLREPKHIGAIVGILIVLIFLWFYNCVHQFAIIKKCFFTVDARCKHEEYLEFSTLFRLWSHSSTQYTYKKSLTCPVKSAPSVLHYNPLSSRHSLATRRTSTSVAHYWRSLKEASWFWREVAFVGVSFDEPHFG